MARLYGRLIDATGWTFAEIDAMAVSDVVALTHRWSDSPPLIECVRAYLGVSPAEVEPEEIDLAPRKLSEEQFRRIREAEEQFAEANFRRNPAGVS